MSWRQLFFGFNGRLNRKPFWLASLALTAAAIALIVIVMSFIAEAEAAGVEVPLPVFLAISAISTFCWLALSVKRLHDRNKSGLWMMIYFGAFALQIAAEMQGLTGTEEAPTIIGLGVVLLSLAASVWYLVDVGLLKGADGPNDYGPDPITGYRADASL
jgi:uncharacterized membrane protein YhaH (DUF805 family)